MPAPEAALEFQQVTKRYGDRTILDDVSVVIPRGQTTVLLGPSGTGKSTLLRLAVGLTSPDHGVVKALGEDLATVSKRRLLALRQRFGMLFQDGALFGSLSVADNVGFPIKQHLGITGDSLRARVDELLSWVGLYGVADRTPDRLSGGQRKRVALARAIALEPEVVLFDEPTSGLDPQTSAAIDALITTMQERLGSTFLVITHDVQSAQSIAHHVGMLFDGKLRAWGTSDAVFRSTDPVVRAFLERRPPADPVAVSSSDESR